MNWQQKARIQNLLSSAPGGMRLNYMMQRAFGLMRNPQERILETFDRDVTVILERMVRCGVNFGQATVVEIGAGWLPILPLTLSLLGTKQTHTYDVNRHLHFSLAQQTLAALESRLASPALTAIAPAAAIAHHFAALAQTSSLAELLRAARIEYCAPADACEAQLSDHSVDVVVSNNVFEHVPPEGIDHILRGSHRLLKKGGLILHCVNCGDHSAYCDPTVSQINYLQFSDDDWARWNNDLNYQNRLRPLDFVRKAEAAGFKVISAEYKPRQEALAQLKTMRVAPEFQSYPERELASTSLTLVATPA